MKNLCYSSIDDWQEGKKGEMEERRGMNERIKDFHFLSHNSIQNIFLNFFFKFVNKKTFHGKVKERNT